MTRTQDLTLRYRQLYLLLNDLYISGIIFIGTQVLLSVKWDRAFCISLLTFCTYAGVVYFATIVVNTFFKSAESILTPYKKSILVAGITATIVVPYAVLVSYLGIGEMASSKYYFYAIVCAGIVFATTTIYGLLIKPTAIGTRGNLEKIFTFFLEMFKTILWVFVFVLLGTAYSQVLTGAPISSGEMFLIFYTSVGCLALILVPIMKKLADVLDRIISLDEWYH